MQEVTWFVGVAIIVFSGALGVTIGFRLKASFDINEWSRERHKRKSKKADEAQYDYIQMGDAWVVVKKGTHAPLFCPVCFDAGKKLPLQPNSHPSVQDMFTHSCLSNCDTRLKLY